jgi:formate dehydrogenase iron-sulfur subunit
VKHIYGSEEVGGTSVFFISDVPFEKLGFVAAPKQPMPTLTANALGDVPTVVLVGGGLLSGLYWITQRRQAVAMAEGTISLARPTDKERS